MLLKLLVTFLFIFQFSEPETDNKASEILEEGLELVQQEAYEDALLIWADAYSTLENPSPAIGREFVKVATEQRINEYYELASIVYFWGLTADEFEPTRESLQLEISTLEPIMDEQEYDEIYSLFENEDPELYQRLTSFWQRMNPTPGAEHNARMIEHWERVAYSLENFTRNESTSFGTDERALSYIRYGEPNRLHEGRLDVTRGQVVSLSSMLDPNADSQYMANIIMDIGLQPEYELWIYNQPNPEMRFNLFKLFGQHPNRGFGRVSQVEDFIPSQHFSFNPDRYRMQSLEGDASPAGINLNPGMIYLWYFYEELASLEPYFAYHFHTITSEWESAEMHLGARESGQNPTSGMYAGQLQMQRNQISALRDLNLAPPEFSTHENNMPEIPVEVFQYRLLDEQNQPVYATFIESKPGQAFLQDFGYNEDRMDPTGNAEPQQLFNHYELTHGLQLLSENQDFISEQRQPTELLIDFEEDEPSRSVFVIPHISESTIQILSAELHNLHPESSRRIESSFTSSLRGLGKTEIHQPEPLSTNPERLEVSDLILGFELQDEPNPNAFLPFVVANNKKIPADEELVVRFEVYNLIKDEEGFAHFELDYEISPETGGFLSRSQEEEASLTLTFEPMDSRFTENIQILTADLDTGVYQLQMTFSDLHSDQQVERKVEFEIIE